MGQAHVETLKYAQPAQRTQKTTGAMKSKVLIAPIIAPQRLHEYFPV
jgi:hypothetical protein